MPAAFSWFLAARYLVTRWVNLLGVGGVAVAVWALIAIIGVFSGFIGEIRDNIRVSSPQLLLTGLEPGEEHSYDELRAIIEADQDVVATAPRLEHYGIYYPTDRGRVVQRTQAQGFESVNFDYVNLLGIDATAEVQVTDLDQWLDVARTFRVADPAVPFDVPPERMSLDPQGGVIVSAPAGLLLSTNRLDRRPARVISPGALIDVVSAREDGGDDLRYIVWRFVASGAFETGHRLFDDTTAILDIEELRTILGHDIDRPGSVDLVSSVAIRVRAGADLDTVAARITASCRELGGGEVQTWEEQNRVFLGAVDQERGLMKLVLFAVMLVAGFLVYSTLHMMVIQKTKDIGILTSMGATRGAIQAIFLLSSLAVSAVGCLLGAVAGYVSLISLNPLNEWVYDKFQVELFPRTLYKMDGVPWRLDASWMITVIVAAVALSLLVAWFPARRAARMEPVQALSYE